MTSHAASRKAALLKVDLDAKIRERDKMNIEIAKLQQQYKAYATMAMETRKAASTFEAVKSAIQSPIALTDMVRAMLTNADQPLSAVDIRKQLLEIGYDFNEYANPLAFISTILQRLKKNNQVRLAKYKGKSPCFEWIR